MSVKEIAVIGLGGVGGYFGFKLAKAFSQENEVAITFIARGDTYRSVSQNGLTLLSPEHPENVVTPDLLLQKVNGLARVDVAVVCVKEYDLEAVCRQLEGKVTEESVILPLMNGVDIYDRIRKIITKGIVLPACVYVASHIKKKGTIEHQGMPGRIIFGKDPKFPQYSPDSLLKIFTRAGIQYEFKDNPFSDIWTKFVFIASFGLVTARYNLPMGKVNEDDQLRRTARLIMQEIVTIAGLKGIVLPANIIDLTFQKASTFPYHTPTSLQLDVHSKRQNNELELFAGAIIRYGEEVKASTVATGRVYEEIKNLP